MNRGVSETLELELCAYWELHQGPLEEQPVFFNYWAISAVLTFKKWKYRAISGLRF